MRLTDALADLFPAAERARWPFTVEQAADALRAAGVGDLDAAWAEAEAALPEGWWIASLELSGISVQTIGGKRDRVSFWDALARGPKDSDELGQAATPAAALRALAAKLRERAG